MPAHRIQSRAATDKLLIIEGAMGLFDGAPDGTGATADLARILRLPVILIIDAGRMSHSIAPLAMGFARHDPDVHVAGVILNNVGSDRHARMLTSALAPTGLPVLGTVPRSPELRHPSRHLGLVQATEHPDLDAFVSQAATLCEAHLDIDALLDIAATAPESTAPAQHHRPAPPAQSIAVAHDAAFAFAYPHLLADWRSSGASLTFFSPLNDDPAPDADLIYLPGGYPELHAGTLAANQIFLISLRKSKSQIYGECGGYMTLGETLTDAKGHSHQMAGLLRVDTSFATKKRHLGYRHLSAASGPFAGQWRGHEFHYATTTRANGTPLFTATDAEATALPDMGLTQNNVSGSFAHLIDRA
jgi:cobyrinic acid a,c-diamide synthase